MWMRISTTLADFVYAAILSETFSAVRASLKRSHDAVDDGVTYGRQLG